MPLPPDVTTFTLAFGPYTTASGTPDLVGLRGQLIPIDPGSGSRISVTHLASGQVILPGPVPVTLGATGAATVVLPHTDQAGLSPRGFAYSVVWFATAFDRSPGNRRIAMPQAAGSFISYALLAPAPSLPGVQVPVGVGPAGPPGPPGDPGPVGPPGGPPPVVTLADAPVIVTDVALSDHFRVAISADRTLGPPVNSTDGMRVLWEVTASGADRLVALETVANGGFVFGTGVHAIPVIAQGTTTFIGATYRASTGRWHVLAVGSGH